MVSAISSYFALGLIVWLTVYCFNRVWLMCKGLMS